jgi:hypothetical protein
VRIGALPARINHRGHRNIEHLGDLSPAHTLRPESQRLVAAEHASRPAQRLAVRFRSPNTHEREVIKERSVAGTLRVAESGAWLGGIVPYGYRKIGERRGAHLVISDQPIPGATMSEADVIRDVFRMAAVEKKSCRMIAKRLNDLRIPCAYTRDDRLVVRGKRRQRTSGVWRPGRIRALITNKTYMGVHEFGKRTKTGRAVISRSAPAIVCEETWRKAQETLKANFLFSARSAKNHYLLRGLIKCSLCGHTYIGVAANRPNGKREFLLQVQCLAFSRGIRSGRQMRRKSDPRR